MKKVKFNLGLVALIAGFGLVMTQSAFTTKNTDVSYHFINGKILSESQSASNWELMDEDTPSCNSSQENLPCILTTDQDLQTYLNSFGSGNYTGIRAAADVKRVN